jgi:hypothetical protein
VPATQGEKGESEMEGERGSRLKADRSLLWGGCNKEMQGLEQKRED